MRIYFLTLLLIVLSFAQCGGAAGDSTNQPNPPDDSDPIDDSQNVVNLEKLVGTPFEGMITGDDIPFYTFQCNQYKTEIISEFPIKVFTAFFTLREEEQINEAIEITNEAIGFTAYQLTEIWADDVRVIYKVAKIADEDRELDAVGFTMSNQYTFNGKSFAELQASDWSIEVNTAQMGGFTIAHELGHASGISTHALIDYENDTLVDFNDDNSIMDAPSGNQFPDYIYMMQHQGQVMQNHLGEIGTARIDICAFLGFE